MQSENALFICNEFLFQLDAIIRTCRSVLINVRPKFFAYAVFCGSVLCFSFLSVFPMFPKFVSRFGRLDKPSVGEAENVDVSLLNF